MKPKMLTRIRIILAITTAIAITACDATTVATVPSTLGTPVSMATVKDSINDVGPIVLNKHLVANWQVPLSGLLNLDHPKAISAQIADRDEPIEIYTYSIVHPEQGTFLVDSGISERFRAPADNSDLATAIKFAMNTDKLVARMTTADLAANLTGIDGVFLTHIHIDHIMGLTDLPASTPVYIGPGDASHRAFLNAFSQGTTDRLLAVQQRLHEWQFGDLSALDVFGDGSFYALHSPGHTPGSTAYLAMTTVGPTLMIGDVTHTRWGWENGVEPGTFSANIPQSAVSLATLKALVKQIPTIRVHPGHQKLP